MMKSGRKVIAILADYPYWNYFEGIAPESHPAPWLSAMHRSFAEEKEGEFELHWITLTKNVKKEHSKMVEGQYMHLLPTGSKTISQYLRYLPDRMKVARFLRRIKPDLLHAWGNESCYGICAKDFKGKKLFSFQGALDGYAKRAAMPPFMVRQARFEREVLPAMPVITAESEWAMERVRELAPQADVRLWEYAAESRFFNVQRRPDKQPMCMMLTSSSHIKNVPTAIAAFSRPELSHVKLCVAGVNPGTYGDVPENILLLGKLKREEISAYLCRAWAFIHPSLADTGPTAVKEARAVGLPCIVSSECGAKRYVVPDKSGYIIDPMNVEQLVDAVLKVTCDEEKSLSMGRYDYERCAHELSSLLMYNKIRSIYTEILSK
ncbi:MAG: glycosyltransferase [Akkermansia sp.]|nr:glycosyltransferase [Akkermansia sp.]